MAHRASPMTKNELAQVVAEIHRRVAFDPEIGIICGSGLSGISSEIKNAITIPYSALPGYPESSVTGHKSEMVFGNLGGKKVVAMRGRFHFYEGIHPKDVAISVKVLGALGIKALIVTNAAGGVDPTYTVGDLMLINDHISIIGMTGTNPLIGVNDDDLGPRFPSTSSTYDQSFRDVFKSCFAKAKKETSHKYALQEGCYFGVSGPNYESRSEIEMMRTLGGKAVGMSTVFEIVQAAHCGIKVLGVSLITNSCLGTRPEDYAKGEPNHKEVTDNANAVTPFVQRVVADFITTVDISGIEASQISRVFTRDNTKKLANEGSSVFGFALPSSFLKKYSYLIVGAHLAFATYMWWASDKKKETTTKK